MASCLAAGAFAERCGQPEQRRRMIVAVEHHTGFLSRAGHLIELGPGGGPEGGRVVFSGLPAALAARGGTPTAEALRGRVQFPAQ